MVFTGFHGIRNRLSYVWLYVLRPFISYLDDTAQFYAIANNLEFLSFNRTRVLNIGMSPFYSIP